MALQSRLVLSVPDQRQLLRRTEMTLAAAYGDEKLTKKLLAVENLVNNFRCCPQKKLKTTSLRPSNDSR